MPWLSSLLKRPEPVLEVIEEEPPPPAPTGPQLAVLVPDIAGISSFRLRLFPDAQSAESHVGTLTPEIRRGVHAFWALHDRPVGTDELHVEALVLIRAREDSDVVYVVSFLDLESANSFTRFEVRRGLQLPNVMICWAAFAQFREELDGVTVHPGAAPVTTPSWLDMRDDAAAPVAPERPVVQSQPAVEDISVAPAMPEVEDALPLAPEPETAVESEARVAIERYLQERDEEERNERPLVEDRFAVMDRPRETTEVEQAPAPEESLWPEAAAETEEPLWPTLEPAASVETEPEAEIFSDLPEEQAALEQAFVLSHEGLSLAETVEIDVSDNPTLEAQVVEAAAEIEAIEPAMSAVEDTVALREPVAPEIDVAPVRNPEVPLSNEAIDAGMVDFDADTEAVPTEFTETIVADEESVEVMAGGAVVAAPDDEELETETETEAEPVVEDELASPHGDPAAAIPQVKQYDEFDIAFEVERLLRNRNWGRRDEPFDGFNSPPGRF